MKVYIGNDAVGGQFGLSDPERSKLEVKEFLEDFKHELKIAGEDCSDVSKLLKRI